MILYYLYTENIEIQNILIYCKKGNQISPAIIACYLIKYGKILPNNAVNIIKTKSNKAFF